MAKTIIEFDLDNYEDRLLHKKMLNAENLYLLLNRIQNELFRPARKHGYGSGHHVQECIDRAIENKVSIDDFIIDEHKEDVVTSSIDYLETEFLKLLQEYNIDME